MELACNAFNALLDLSPVPRTLELRPSRRQKVFKLDMTEMLRDQIRAFKGEEIESETHAQLMERYRQTL